MEANLFIKNAKLEGNKVKEIEFFGDWEIDTSQDRDIFIKSLTRNVLPEDITLVTPTYGRRFRFKNNSANKTYYIRFLDATNTNITTTITTFSPGYSAQIANLYQGDSASMFVFSDAKCQNAVGYIKFAYGDTNIDVEHY